MRLEVQGCYLNTHHQISEHSMKEKVNSFRQSVKDEITAAYNDPKRKPLVYASAVVVVVALYIIF